MSIIFGDAQYISGYHIGYQSIISTNDTEIVFVHAHFTHFYIYITFDSI